MSPSSPLTRRRAPALAVVALVLLVATVVWIARPERADSTVPPLSKIGTLTFTTISGAVVPLRSFSFEATAPVCDPVGGGICVSKADFGQPVVTLDTSILSPAELDALAIRRHLERLTVDLYKPNTNNRAQEYVFDEAIFTKHKTVTDGPNSAEPRETLSWSYRRVTVRMYNPANGAVVSEACYDVALARRC
jgi:hypothetical protein